MAILTITEFCDKHNACREGRTWALKNCKNINDVWRTAKHDWLIWVATRPGVVDDATLRIFAVECVRSVQYLLTDKRSINVLDVAHSYAIGEATSTELDAAWAAAGDAARAAAGAAVWATARAAAGDAARAAARDAAWAAARDAAWAAEWAAAWAAAHKAQDECLRGMATPNFEVE